MKDYFKRMLGSGQSSPPRRPIDEIIWSWIGGFCGIYGVHWINGFLGVAESDSLYLIGSFGASAVLIYGAPAGDLSQPRNLIGGHIVSAFCGVAAYKCFPEAIPLAAALGVATAIACMHLTRTLHPPGGATALIAVISGESIHNLGFYYVFAPVFVGAFIMLIVALLVNNLSKNKARAYPKFWW